MLLKSPKMAVLAGFLFACCCGEAAGPRTALVVGNAKYEAAFGPLRNSSRDAKAMAATLRGLGFAVIERHDVTRDQLLKAMLEFRKTLADAEVGLFYYAGHGLAVAGANYLVPVKSGFNAEGADETTRRMLAETRLFNVEQAVADMKSAGGRCHLVILDACRTPALAVSGRTRDAPARGALVEMSPPAGSLVAFATDAGHTAFDGEGRHGLYTEELLKHLLTPGLTIEQVFKRTRAGVLERSDGGQMPAEYSRLIGEDIYLAGLPEPVAMGAARQEEPAPVARPASFDEAMKLAKAGDAAACVAALREMAAEREIAEQAVEPLAALLEGVKEDLKVSEAPSPKVIAAAETCTLVLEALPDLIPAEHEWLGELTAKAFNRRGDALLLLGQPGAALEHFEAALELTDEDAYIFYNRGCALLALGREEGARANFERAAGPEAKQPGARRLAQEALRRMRGE